MTDTRTYADRRLAEIADGLGAGKGTPVLTIVSVADTPTALTDPAVGDALLFTYAEYAG